MRAERSDQFLADVESYAYYLFESSPESSFRFVDAVEQTVRVIETMPLGGSAMPSSRHLLLRARGVIGFRQMLVLYEPREETLLLVRLIHGARDLPTLFAEET
ncbi:type II toxin-antitoxin system RelE/ParE family toxin [Bremerella sp. JC770]|uniref:type II toxin-antitoxin system RelE/ParE family toxin n=1 Tax=Bremerella sp. JC770 TaxID=3232137 RepID=UPI00345B0B5F